MRTVVLALVCGLLAGAAGTAGPEEGPSAQGVLVPAPIPRTVDAPDVEQPEVDLSRKASTSPRPGAPKTTRFSHTLVNLHTRELMPVTGDAVDSDMRTAQRRLNRFLRCRATHRTTQMATEPVDVAIAMADRFDARRIEVISGYRSEKFNEILRKKGHEVAENSHHIRGQALDFRIPGVGTAQLARAVAEMHEGGIGTYRHSGFVHADIGRDRRWTGY